MFYRDPVLTFPSPSTVICDEFKCRWVVENAADFSKRPLVGLMLLCETQLSSLFPSTFPFRFLPRKHNRHIFNSQRSKVKVYDSKISLPQLVLPELTVCSVVTEVAHGTSGLDTAHGVETPQNKQEDVLTCDTGQDVPVFV